MFYLILILSAFIIYAVIDTVINKNAHKERLKIVKDAFDNAVKF